MSTNNAIPKNLRAHDVALGATFKFFVYSICNSLCKVLNQVDSSLDVSQDFIDTAKVHSDLMKKEASVTAQAQLKALETQLTLNSNKE